MLDHEHEMLVNLYPNTHQITSQKKQVLSTSLSEPQISHCHDSFKQCQYIIVVQIYLQEWLRLTVFLCT